MTRDWLDLGASAAIVLTILKLHEREFTQREIIDLLGVPRETVSRVLGRLENHHIVRRSPVPSGPHRNSRYGRAHFVYRWSGGPEIGGQP